jgi:septum formation protein
LLNQLGLSATVLPANIDESKRPSETAEDYVLRMAMEKAVCIAEQQPDAIVLGADTAVVLGQQVFGKPQSEVEGVQMLQQLSAGTHRVLSAVAVHGGDGLQHQLVASKVTFRSISLAEATAYWRSGEPADKAGGYAIQGLGAVFVESLNGSYSGVMGLPLFETAQLLAASGIHLF